MWWLELSLTNDPKGLSEPLWTMVCLDNFQVQDLLYLE